MGAGALVIAAVAWATPLAVTIDDVPFVGNPRPGETRDEATVRLVAALTERQVPATAFVVCEGNGDLHVLPRWIEAGVPLGNHTATHLDLGTTAPDVWLADVARCQETLGAHAGPWFRFPYLSTGPTVEVRDEVVRALAAMGLKSAPVSLETLDWLLAAAYAEALSAEDTAAQARIAKEYSAHLVRAGEHHRTLALTKFGRDVPLVLLVHANSLAADHLGDALDALHAAGFEYVSLDEALADPVYALPDAYVGPVGTSWFYRVAPLDTEDSGWDAAEREAIRRAIAADPTRGRKRRR